MLPVRVGVVVAVMLAVAVPAVAAVALAVAVPVMVPVAVMAAVMLAVAVPAMAAVAVAVLPRGSDISPAAGPVAGPVWPWWPVRLRACPAPIRVGP